MAFCTCRAPLDRTVCLTAGLWATGDTSLEDNDICAVLKLIFVKNMRVVLGLNCTQECFTALGQLKPIALRGPSGLPVL